MERREEFLNKRPSGLKKWAKIKLAFCFLALWLISLRSFPFWPRVSFLSSSILLLFLIFCVNSELTFAKVPATISSSRVGPVSKSRMLLLPKSQILTPCIVNRNIEGISLRSALERVVAECGWDKVIWHTPIEYWVEGKVQLESNTFAEAVSELLKDYPLQAVFYNKNKIVEIKPRRDGVDI